MLCLTSFLFATNVLHAYLARNAVVHHCYLLLLSTSLAHHWAEDKESVIHSVDLVVAHSAFGLISVLLMDADSVPLGWLLIVLIAAMWGWEFLQPDHANVAHIIIHVAACLAGHCVLL